MTPLIETCNSIKTCSSKFFAILMSFCSAILVVSSINIHLAKFMASLNGDTSRPRVNVTVNGIEKSWLYDTGAARTCISTAMFHTLFPHGISRTVSANVPSLNLQDAGGNSLGLYGIFTIDFLIMGKTIQHEIWVCDKITDHIIGYDFIKKHNLAFDTMSEQVHWYRQPHPSVLSLSHETNFPALTTTVIKTRFNGHATPFAPHIATIGSTKSRFLQGGPALVNISDDGFCTVAITNCAPYDIDLPRDSIIGLIETEGQSNKIEQLSQDKIKSIFASINLIATTKISSKDFTKEQIEAKINLNVPAEFRSQYIDLLFKHREALSISKTDLGRAKHFFHKIHLKNDDPVYRKQFKIPDAHSDFISQTIDDWLKLGVIRRSSSMYNSPIFCVPKKNGVGLRIVQDFRELNAHSHIDKYSMKEISECIGEIGRANSTIFTTLDLTSGFWQMPMHPKDAHLTAFTIPSKGQFEWLTSPMGLLGCPASFQRLMESAMQGIAKVIVYIDDLLVHTASHPEQLSVLDVVFERLVSNGLKVNLDKCFFGNKEVSYLGFTLTPNGISPGKDKLQAIRDAKAPTDIKMVRSFIGLCNFFRTHIKNFATISAPLTQLTRKDCSYKGGTLPDDAMRAYKTLKLALTSDPVVAYPRADRQYALIVDASTGTATTEGGMGAILTQVDKNGQFHVISYGSRQLVKHEKNYSPYLVEMAAAVWGMEFYNEYLKGKHFVLYTDHQPLERLSHLHTKTLNRLQLAMLEYDFLIQYKKGINMPADFLSRSQIDEIAAIDPFTPTLREEQSSDADIIKLKQFHEKGTWPANTSKADIQKLSPLLNKFFVRDGLIWIRLNDFERQRNALYLPLKYRKRALCEGHGSILSGHDAITKTYLRITDSYVWPGIKSDIHNHITSCLQCQLRKKSTQKPVPLHPLPIPELPNQRIHVDLFGPLKSSNKANKFILCITDAFTKYAEVIAIPDKTAETVANEIFTHWICRFGSPLQVHSDGGKEFCNKLSDEMYELLDIKHTKTSPAHPQCNAQVEVFNKTLAKYLSCVVDETTLDWEQYIPSLMFSYNTSYHSTIMSTPFELLYGMKARTPSFPNQDLQQLHYGESFASERLQILQKARQIAHKHSETNIDQYKNQFDKKSIAHDFKVGDLVLFAEYNYLGRNKKLSPKWLGPATIISTTETNCKIRCENGKIKLLNVSHLKHFNLENAKLKFNEHLEDESFDTPAPPTFSEQIPPPNEIFNEPPATRPHTRSLTRLLQEQHTINFAETDLRIKLSAIATKLYKHNISWAALTESEKALWSSFSVDDIMFFLTSQREHTPDFSEYLTIHRSNRQQPQQPEVLPQPQPQPDQPQPPQPPQPQRWPAYRADIDPRNIIPTPRTRKNPFQRLARSASKRFANISPK